MLILVLGSPQNWYVRDLDRAAGDDHEILSVDYRELHSTVQQDGTLVLAGREDLAKCDAVLVRSMPPGSLEQVVFRMNALAQLDTAGVRVVNSPRAIEVAVDKYLASARLQRAGLLVPQTIACQTAQQATAGFEKLGRDVVVKPIFGGEGRGISRITDLAAAKQCFAENEATGAVTYLQEFIEHNGCDIRLLVVGKAVLGMKRTNPDDWRTNISRGAHAESLEVTPELAEIAHCAARAVGAEIAGVDLLPGKDGRLYALEVNAVPGWRALAACTGVDVAQMVIEQLGKVDPIS